jgi:hypothetical protein
MRWTGHVTDDKIIQMRVEHLKGRGLLEKNQTPMKEYSVILKCILNEQGWEWI